MFKGVVLLDGEVLSQCQICCSFCQIVFVLLVELNSDNLSRLCLRKTSYDGYFVFY